MKVFPISEHQTETTELVSSSGMVDKKLLTGRLCVIATCTISTWILSGFQLNVGSNFVTALVQVRISTLCDWLIKCMARDIRANQK